MEASLLRVAVVCVAFRKCVVSSSSVQLWSWKLKASVQDTGSLATASCAFYGQHHVACKLLIFCSRYWCCLGIVVVRHC
jgi:hypothetical protein